VFFEEEEAQEGLADGGPGDEDAVILEENGRIICQHLTNSCCQLLCGRGDVGDERDGRAEMEVKVGG
jgi:hypothetical protein